MERASRYFFQGLRQTMICGAALVLTSCAVSTGERTGTTPKAPRSAEPSYQAADFVRHLSLAYSALADTKPGVDAAADHLEAVQAYTAKQPRRARRSAANRVAVRQSVVILECEVKTEKKPQRLAIPFDMQEPREESGRQALQELLTGLSEESCLLHDAWPATITVTRGEPLAFADADPQQTLRMVRERLASLLDRAARPASPMDAKAQVALARLFIEMRQRDAAYLAVENAKLALAAVENLPGEKEFAQNLLDELEELESDLHKTMPFRL